MNRRYSMPFGKYRGIHFDHIPGDYLEWLLEQDWLRPYMRQTIEDYLEYGADGESDGGHWSYTGGTYGTPPPRPPPVPPPPALDSAERMDLEKMLKLGFRALALKYHPDTGGDHENMKRLNALIDKLKRAGWL